MARSRSSLALICPRVRDYFVVAIVAQRLFLGIPQRACSTNSWRMSHGGGTVQKSGFDLSTREGLLRGGDNGPAVVPGDAQASSLYKRIKHEVQPGMPFQGSKLPEDLIARIAEWINAGAPYDRP